MPLTREQLGARLRELRESLGFTQKQVAEALGLHRPTISEIEAGRRDVISEELFQFARLYVTTLAEILSEPKSSANQAIEVLYRKPGLGTPEAKRVVKRFAARCRDEIELERLLEIGRLRHARPSYEMPDPDDVLGSVKQGESMAADERRRLGLGGEPLRNPLDLLEQQGVRIGPLEDGDLVDVDGIYFETEELGACVAVNLRRDDRTGFRAAFTAAHEYAHWLLRDIKVEEFAFGLKASDLYETRANAFAAAFLMPAQGLRDYFTNLGTIGVDGKLRLSRADIVRAMDFFGVSRQALLYRLQNTNLLDVDTVKELREEEWPVDRVGQLADKLGLGLRRQKYISTRLPILAVEAWRRGVVSTGRAAELVGEDIESFRNLMREWGAVQELPADDQLIGAAAH